MTLTAVLRNPRNDNYGIFIRIQENNKTKYKSTGAKIKQKFWNPNATRDRKNWVRTNHSRFSEINRKISDMLIQIEAEKRGLVPEDILRDQEKNITGGNTSFLKYAQQDTDDIRNKGTRESHQTALNKFIQYLEQQDNLSLKFKEMNSALVNKYYRWMLDSKLETSTANQYMAVIKGIFNNAKNDEKIRMDVKVNPFVNFKYGKTKSKSGPLEPNEYLVLKNFDTRGKEQWEEAKCMFLFQFANAMRFKDAIHLQWRHLRPTDEFIRMDLHTSKTTDRINRDLPDKVVELLKIPMKRYFPHIEEELDNYNTRLQELQQRLEKAGNSEKELSASELLIRLKSGKSLQKLEQELESSENRKKNIEEIQTHVQELEDKKRIRLRQIIKELHIKHPQDYVWSKPYEEALDGELSYEAYQRCGGSHYSHLQTLRKKAGIISRLTSHVARHTATQFLIDSGKSMTDVSQFLTHADELTTKDYYKRMGKNNLQLSTFLSNML